MKVLLIVILCSVIFSCSSSDQLNKAVERINGVTIDDVNELDDIVVSLDELSKRPTVRIVFDSDQPAAYYKEPVERIHKVSFIMGELLDSYDIKDYSVRQYKERTSDYVSSLGNKVDIWEIGNEVNGEWLGNSDSVMKKIMKAYRLVKSSGNRCALTLYYNDSCRQKPENEMFRWAGENIPGFMRDSLDYIFVSYYEDECNDLQPEWQSVFDSLHVLFNNSMIGIGECGSKFADKKEEYLKRYYSMQIKTPNYVGGYFWWYYKQDCVPKSKPMWKVLDNVLKVTQ
jgi:hypothetical protein